MPRFAILEHDWPTTHWDFLLEAGAVARAWRLRAEPAPGRDVPAEPNADHRLVYLEYEGEVGGGRGSVRRWDAGTFEWIEDSPARIEVALASQKLVGHCLIECRAGGAWFAAFH